MLQIPNQKIKQAYFLFFLTLMGALLFYWMKDFISSFLGALTMYILMRKPLLYLQEQKRWNKTLVVILLMLASILLLILPVGLTTMMLSSKVGYLVEHYKEFLTILQQYSAEISQRFGIDILSNDTIQKLTETGARIIPTILSGALNSVTQVAVLYFVLYFMLMEGSVMEKIVMENSPFHNDNTLLLAKELNTQTVSNAVGIPVLATLQAIFACVGYLIFGMDQVLFWAVITGLFSILPLVGTLIIWVPLSVYLYFNGLHWQGIGLFLYGALVITNVDNVFRFMVQKKLGDTHPLITFFGVIVGLDLFGFIGIIFGPLLISYFLILLEIYKKEYAGKENWVK